jgi:protein O-GlcNAc transferase
MTALQPAANELLKSALSAHRSGRIVEAEALYTNVLSIYPDHCDAKHYLGILRAQQGRNEEALTLIGAALDQSPSSGHYHLNYSNVLFALGRHAEAMAGYDKALSISPTSADARNNRGNLLLELKRYQEALQDYDKALLLKSQDAITLNNRATALIALRRPEAALIDIGKALELRPDFVEALNNRGNALKDLRRYELALSSYDRAIELRPNYFKALSNRGLVYFELARFEDALASMDVALAIAPNYAEALNGRGNALLFLGRNEEAILSYEKAISIRPDHPWAKNGLADAVLKACDWPRAQKLAYEMERHIVESKSVINPFTLLGYGADPALQLRCAKAFLDNRIPALPSAFPQRPSLRHNRTRIRVAYLSADFRTHPVASLIAGLFELHNREQFEIFGISFGQDDGSPIRSRIVAAMDRFYDIRLKSDLEAAKLLSDLEIDIAVDLTGYTLDARPGILCHRPAPIQVSYLGFPATTAATFIDYIIADETVLPFHEQQFYTEQIIHLPNCYMVTDSKRKIASTIVSRREAGLPERGFVFCCFNNSYKITEPIFGVWMRLLEAIENSVLWLSQATAAVTERLRSQARAHGIDDRRLVFAAKIASAEDHLARLRLADLFLDTLPFNAHATAVDALWVGLPLLTCLGNSFCGRVAASLLQEVGLSDLVASNLKSYEVKALRLATDPSLLECYRAILKRNRDAYPLFDTDLFRRNLEKAYRSMWDRWLRGEPPTGFTLAI